MYGPFRRSAERLLRIPDEPDPPPGDEASTRRFRAAPNYYYYLLVTWAIRTAILLAVILPTEILPSIDEVLERGGRSLAAYSYLRPPFLIAALIILQRFFALAVIRLDFEKRWYLVTDRSLRLREGVWNIREMTITFANIQNISISQGPIQRLLGLADLRVDTAGGGAQTGEKQGKENSHGVRFRGVNNAEEIRALINTRLRQLKDSGLGDSDDVVTTVARPNKSLHSHLAAPLGDILAEASALRQAVAKAR